jgi:ubiquinone/menaquinone biosynthesis C-methylase UbiE
MASIATSYNTRAPTYDDKTTFHRQLASSYITYAKPQPGESLLDLACGTGLVTFEFAPLLQSNPQNVTHRASGPNASKPVIVGVDISKGMLDVARSKRQNPSNQDAEIQFVEHDITCLSSIPELRGKQDTFDIITICSALVLLPDPAEAIKQWAGYLKKGGRMIVDVPHTHSMLSLKILDIIASELAIDVLGKRAWIEGPQSLKAILRNAGLEPRVLVTDV